MSNRVNFADPDFEPSDDQLRALSTAAFANVGVARELALKRLRAEIAREQAKIIEALDLSKGSERRAP